MAKAHEVSTMDVIISIIMLLVSVCSIGRTTASYKLTLNMILGAEFCYQTCSCWNDTQSYKIGCPFSFFDPSFVISIMHTNVSSIEIDCFTKNEAIYAQLPEMNIGDVTEVSISNCPLPTSGTSLMTNLNRLGVGIKKTKKLTYTNLVEAYFTTSLLSGFTELEYLALNTFPTSELPEDLFDDVRNITTLILTFMGDLPVNNIRNLRKLQNIDFSHNSLKTLEPGAFKNQQNLKTLNLLGNELQHLTKESFEGLSSLLKLNLRFNHLSTLPADLFVNQSNLLDLDLATNGIIELDDGLFESLGSLIVLRLSNNKLTMISGILFRGMHSVQEIYLDRNNLKSLHHSAFKYTQQIRHLQLDKNQLSSFSENEEGIESGSPFQYLTQLQTLNLQHNEVKSIESNWLFNNNNLKELDLSYNNLSHLTFSDLQFSSDAITINLAHNGIKYLDFSQYRVIIGQNFTRTAKVILNYNPIICDNRLFHFIEYIQQKDFKNIIIEADQLNCSPSELIGKPVTQLTLKDITCSLHPPNIAKTNP